MIRAILWIIAPALLFFLAGFWMYAFALMALQGWVLFQEPRRWVALIEFGLSTGIAVLAVVWYVKMLRMLKRMAQK